MNAPVHTSALQRPAEPESDLFVAAPPQPAHIYIELEAVLVRNAEVRDKPVGDGHHVPVLCLELSTNRALHQTLHVEQVFTEATRHLADQKAATLKRGGKVRITTNLLDMRVCLPHAEHIESIA